MNHEAIGIAINGREVKIVHMVRDKYRLLVNYLESAVLKSDLEEEAKLKSKQAPDSTVLNEDDDIFSIKEEPYRSKAQDGKRLSARENADIIYSLLRKFTVRKIKVGFNIPASSVSYQDLDTHLDYDKNVFKGTLRKKIEEWKQGFNSLESVSVITRGDGTLCNVSCENQRPAIIGVLEQLNSFYRGNISLALMEPNEIALVNLAKNSYNFRDPNDCTAIIEMETEFSRIIFMKGGDLLSVSPIITESFNPDIMNIIYSKIIFELDNYNITDIKNILLAGKASTSTAKEYFEDRFPEARVGFIVSQPLAENLTTQYAREDLSEYAIPIALAWKLIDSKNENFIPTNLMPTQILDRQNVFKLTFTSYILLAFLGITSFFFTVRITSQKIENKSLRTKNRVYEERIRHSETTVKRVQELEHEIAKLTKSISLSDSLGFGSDRLLGLLERLNETVARTGKTWIDEIQNARNGFIIKGVTLERVNSPEIAKALGNAKTNKLLRIAYGNQKAFSFEIQVDAPRGVYQPGYEDMINPSTPLPAAEPPKIKMTSAEASETQPAIVSSLKTEDQTITVVESPATENNENIADESVANTSPQVVTEAVYQRNDTRETSSANQTVESNQPVNDQNKASSHYTIQVSAHAIKFTANKEVQFFQSKGYDAFVTTQLHSSRDIPYWVCIGDYTSYLEAEQSVAELEKLSKREFDIVNTGSATSERVTAETTPIERRPIQTKISESGRDIPEVRDRTIDADKQGSPESARSTHSSGYYTIRLSAHATQLTAKKDVSQFKRQGYDAFITLSPHRSQNVPLWVCYGEYKTYDEAKAKMLELKQSIPGDYYVFQSKIQ